MKKLTQTPPKAKQPANEAAERLEEEAEKSEAKCCAKTSRHAVGCHD